MAYIGNIVVNDIGKTDFPTVFNICKRYEERIANLPTLIVGISEAKAHMQDYNILVKRDSYSDVWWTFSKFERRYDYEEDIERFMGYCVENIFKPITFRYISVVPIIKNDSNALLEKMSETESALRHYLLYSNEIWEGTMRFLVNIIDNNLFLYELGESVVYGVSIKLYEYIYSNREELITRVSHNEKMELLNNGFERSIPYYVRREILRKPHLLLPAYAYFRLANYL